jgi:ABC-type transport system involved in multi-copper enzyme maturation permease subunit
LKESLFSGVIMIRMKQVMAIARAEMLIVRRLVRYWVFLGLAYLIALLYTAQLSAIHGLFSSFSGTVGGIAPRFLLSIIGLFYSIIFLVGTIFLAFDIRARDYRERMSEVLDSRPYSNLELVAGRFLGVFLSSWIPVIALAILLELLGLILKGVGSPVGEPIEIFSLFSFVFIMAIPALSFFIALIFFVTLLVRNRLVAAVAMLILIGLCYWAMVSLPSVYGALFDISGFGSSFFTSEIIPGIPTSEGWIQRFSVLCAAFSLLGFSAAVHPRLDGGSRLKLTAGSIMVMMIALFLTGILYYNNIIDLRSIKTWKEAHAAFIDETVPDLRKVSGNIRISPGKDLYLDLDVTFGAPKERPLHKALFTLNPGQEVKSVSDSSGKSVNFTHENGLLELTLPQALGPGEITTVHLTVEGLPDDRFAFLESAFSLSDTSGMKAGDIPLLGMNPGIFDKAFVALMPGLRWLPVSGPEKGRDDPRIRAVDYFDVNLKVDLPGGWLVAGPGRRHKVEGDNDGVSFRFSPQAPVPEVALIASRFESRSMEIEGVTLEVLINKRHMKNLEVLADTGGKIREWVGGRLKEAKEYGLGYPYDAITLVEVPNILRSYGGGWRLDTAMAPPGILLMRETGFPTARFDSAFRKPEDFKDREGGIQQAKWERLNNFFTNDFSGGNILSGGTRNFFLYQTSAKGPEGLALNYVMEVLSNLLITETKTYFSAHIFLQGDGLDRMINTAVGTYVGDPLKTNSIVDQTIGSAVSRPEVWDKALDVSLKDMDPWEDPALTVDVLTLKANAIAQSILDTMGREKTGQFLASIRQAHKGESFSLNDMTESVKALGYDLTDILGDWLGSTELPGFVCEKARIYRIPDSENGNPRYQMLFTIRNDEPVPGFFRFIYRYEGEGGKPHFVNSNPIRLVGKRVARFGAIVSDPPGSIFLEPYISLNRTSILLPLSAPDKRKIENTEAIEGLEELPYSVSREESIIIDDLDPGFSVMDEEKGRGLRIVARKDKKKATDHGLPVTSTNRIPRAWSRAVYITSFGKYRQTLAVVGNGEGKKKAMFKADINRPGQWELELHIPPKQGIMPGRRWGTCHLVITDGNGDQHEIKFNSQTASPGWNMLERIYLTEGETTVTISDKTDGEFVVADAIRWSPSVGD